MFWDFDGFDPDEHLAAWCRERFGPAADSAERCYRRLFDSFAEDAASNKRRWMDGEILHLGERVTQLVTKRLAAGEKPVESPAGVRDKLRRIEHQLAAAQLAGGGSESVLAQLDGADRRYFETNFVFQQGILVGLLAWTQETLKAVLALSEGDRAEAIARLEAALAAIDRIREAQALATRGHWEHWYRGDKKMNLARARGMTRDLLAAVRKKEPTAPSNATSRGGSRG